jgi:hypothetical protein
MCLKPSRRSRCPRPLRDLKEKTPSLPRFEKTRRFQLRCTVR